ncbi:hypothetical protein HDU96_005902 [Phlyctochytrium bullatum]|nr:hypothetical protein HDU96_005902 [Phlyctochytrium bullatum]
MFEDLDYAVRDGVCVVAIKREKSLNSMRDVTYREIRIALRKAEEDKNVVALILTGRGKFFSSGADVSANRAPLPDYEESWDAFRSRLAILTDAVTRAFINFPKPLVIALNGPVIGFPAGMIASADVIYAAESAFLHTPFMTLGLCPEGASSAAFVHRMGPGNAADVLLFGRKLSSRELLACGFVQRIFPDEAFHENVEKLVRGSLATANPTSLIVSKRLIRDSFAATYSRAAALELDVLTERFASGDPARAFQKLKEQVAAKKKASKL